MDRDSRKLLWAVAGCAALFCAVLVMAYGSSFAQRLDSNALTGFLSLRWGPLREVATRAVQLGDPPAVALLGVGLAAVALLRGKALSALAVLALVGFTSVSSQVLKSVLARPRLDGASGTVLVQEAAFPSGHATAAMALAIACVLVAPRAVRPLAAVLGAALALGVGLSLIVVGSHFPSDVAGGFLLAAGWGFAVVLTLRLISVGQPEWVRDRGVPAGVREVADGAVSAAVVVLAAGAAALLLLGAVLLLLRGSDEIAYLARDHTSALVVGPALVALALALLAATWAGLRRPA